MGDSGYECNYCNGKNHLENDCMLRRLNEKKEGEDDETYHLRKVEEIKKKKNANKSMSALIVQENNPDDEFGRVELCSIDSEDEEVRMPTHGRSFIAKEKDSQFGG